MKEGNQASCTKTNPYFSSHKKKLKKELSICLEDQAILMNYEALKNPKPLFNLKLIICVIHSQ